MLVDIEIKTRGLEALSRCLGLVDAERFICLLQRDRFDYTQWRQTLFAELSGEEISRRAMVLSRQKNSLAVAEAGVEYKTRNEPESGAH
ncbi:MAG: hypothetical protein MUC65_09615 [Pontiellaceae bacterium]|jgi:hypothetical protein|nr:hypothetical protein [Pontiellaceae bacterium]